jgi:hypothetical protein
MASVILPRFSIRRILAMKMRLLTLACLLAASTVLAAAEAQRPTRILWVGSSSTYFHDAPKLCAEWITREGRQQAVSELVGRSGTGIHVYLRANFKAEYGLPPGQSVLEKIARGRYDYVVLQVPAEFINGPEGDEHDKSLDVYCKAIRTAGAMPVFYEMGWGRDEQAAVGRQKIFAAAVRNRITRFVPCATAWQRVRTERPEMELQNPPERAHPGTLGCYLNLCLFYATFLDKEPPPGPAKLKIWRHPDDAKKKPLAEQVKATAWDDYDRALPTWMKTNIVAATEEPIPDATAAYLRKIAWAEHNAVHERLKQAVAAEEKKP